jgi:hypothetical protein
MSEATEATKPHTPAAPKPAASTPTPAAAKEDEKRSITLTFTGADLALYESIVKDADEDERTPSGLLLRYIRKNYGGRKE